MLKNVETISKVALLYVLAVPFARGADAAPRAVAAWTSGPLEVRVALDRPGDPAGLAGLIGARAVFGPGVKAGDRPGATGDDTRGSIQVAAARLVDGGRTLVLSTDPHPRDTAYALSLPPGLGGDLAYGLRGVEVIRDDGGDDGPRWLGWWPTLDWADARARLAGTAALAGFEAKAKAPGRVTLKALVTSPKGKVAIRARASSGFELGLGNESATSKPEQGGHQAEVSAESDGGPIDLTLTITLDGKAPFALAVDSGGRPIPSDRLTLPWAPPPPSVSPFTPAPVAVLTGGDPAKGAILFKGDQAKCAACHKVRGEGGEVGPDLSDAARRGREWTYQQINEPSAVIHPDYLPYTVLTKDGRVLVGVVRAEGADAIKVVDAEAKATVVLKAEVDELKPSGTSIMPVGLLGPLGEDGVRDLLAFLAGK